MTWYLGSFFPGSGPDVTVPRISTLSATWPVCAGDVESNSMLDPVFVVASDLITTGGWGCPIAVDKISNINA